MLLLALDGNSIVNRAFYGVRPLTTRDGLYTNAIYGFLNILQKLLDETKPEALCVTFDKKRPPSAILPMRIIRGPGSRCRRNWPCRCRFCARC